jgi:hypothetical protein
MINQCTKVDSRSKGNTIMVNCAPVERTQWRTTAGSGGCDHEKGRDTLKLLAWNLVGLCATNKHTILVESSVIHVAIRRGTRWFAEVSRTCTSAGHDGYDDWLHGYNRNNRDGFCRVARYCMDGTAWCFDHRLGAEWDCKMALRGCWHGRSSDMVMLISSVLWFIWPRQVA